MLSQNDTDNPFSGRIRVRVCGILEKDDRVLFLKHKNLGPAGYLWIPPGGGVEFGESLHEALKKEFLEETNLEIEVQEFLFANEYIGDPYHAIELFFSVKHISGALKLGFDPELPASKQMLEEARYFSNGELSSIPDNAIHNAFSSANRRDKMTDLRGLFTFKH